jgi:hypothetical protein
MLTAAELLAALVGQSVEFALDGLGTVRVRGLTMLEYEQIRATVGDSEVRTMHAVMAAGLVEPQLSAAELEAISLGRATTASPLFWKIMSLSALNPDDEKATASFGGGGS